MPSACSKILNKPATMPDSRWVCSTVSTHQRINVRTGLLRKYSNIIWTITDFKVSPDFRSNVIASVAKQPKLRKSKLRIEHQLTEITIGPDGRDLGRIMFNMPLVYCALTLSV